MESRVTTARDATSLPLSSKESHLITQRNEIKKLYKVSNMNFMLHIDKYANANKMNMILRVSGTSNLTEKEK